MNQRDYIHPRQVDCPLCGHELDRYGVTRRDALEIRICRSCQTSWREAPRDVDREIVQSRWPEFLERLGEHAAKVRAGEASGERLARWMARAAKEWGLPLTPVAMEAVLMGVCGEPDDDTDGTRTGTDEHGQTTTDKESDDAESETGDD